MNEWISSSKSNDNGFCTLHKNIREYCSTGYELSTFGTYGTKLVTAGDYLVIGIKLF